MPVQINIADIQRAAQTSIPLSFKLAGLLRQSFPLLDRILEFFLSELGQEKIQEPLSYCLKELISNAQKANAKRIYFEDHKLDISSGYDYQKGMQRFLGELTENFQHFDQRLREKRVTVDVSFHAKGGSLTIAVRNGVALAPEEQARIKQRIARARAFNSFFEVLETPIDKTEGAGLGIMILAQFLKRIGLGENAFSIRSDKGTTTARVVIPISAVNLDQTKALTDFLAREIESLPHFPESVSNLIRLTEDSNASVKDISDTISTDPTLTADLLRHVNSAYYGLPARVNNVAQAVKLLGMRSLHLLFYSFGFHLMIAGNQMRLKRLWEHSLRAAFYSFLLARDFKRKQEIVDDAYVAGILHDIGLIAITTLHPATQTKMRQFSMQKNIPPRILERFSFGMHHADIGALIAQKWNFPESLIEGIKYHHEPLLASAENKDVVFCVYLANAICDLERGFISYGQVEKPVLVEFGVRTEAQFHVMVSTLREAFDRRQAELSRR